MHALLADPAPPIFFGGSLFDGWVPLWTPGVHCGNTQRMTTAGRTPPYQNSLMVPLGPMTAATVYDEFKGKPGSNYIATEYALNGLIRWIGKCQPRVILEVGPGIGTTTRAVMATLDRLHGEGNYQLAGIEHVPFCLDQMANNLGADLAKTTVVDRYELVPDWGPIEFLLVDGGGEGEADGSLAPKHVASQNALYVSNLASRAVVFVENKRPNQRAIYEAGNGTTMGLCPLSKLGRQAGFPRLSARSDLVRSIEARGTQPLGPVMAWPWNRPQGRTDLSTFEATPRPLARHRAVVRPRFEHGIRSRLMRPVRRW